MPEAVAGSIPAPSETFGATLRRNLALAGGVGAGLALHSHSLMRWLPASLVMLWPTLGGHYLEIAFLALVGPRLPKNPAVHVVSRVLMWLAGGVLVTVAMRVTGRALGDTLLASWPPLWIGAIGMIGLELIVHTTLWARGLPSIFDPHRAVSGAT